jgi:beta-xylosidase
MTFKRQILLLTFAFLTAMPTMAQEATPLTATSWGDQGNGTYANPVLLGDYSDPDVIRVGNKYYMVCSEFHFMGMPVLESDDLVNWKIIGQVYRKLDLPGYDNMKKYGEGSWAPAIRFHNGTFYIYFCSPNEGLFVATAKDPAGPWETKLIKEVQGWEDPCPLWDDDTNTAWLGHSRLGGGPIIIHQMSLDGMQLLDEGVTVYNGDVAEGTKLYKHNGLFCICIPEGGVSTGWQTIMFSRKINGMYASAHRVLEQGSTNINGPHQGALVDTPDGQWWFFHFQSHESQGRVVHLQPVDWSGTYPIIGKDYDGNGIGEPVKAWTKPATGVNVSPYGPQSSDDFSSTQLGWQWEFNHNPVDDHWSLTETPGCLTLMPIKASALRESRNQVVQKMMGYKSQATTILDFSDLANGERAGLLLSGNKYAGVGVRMNNGTGWVYVETDGAKFDVNSLGTATQVWLRVDINAVNNQNQFYYSVDGVNYTKAGRTFETGSRDWKGPHVGIYAYAASEEDTGKARFSQFCYIYDGPGPSSVAADIREISVSDQAESNTKVYRTAAGIYVDSASVEPVKVYTIGGRLICQGLSNQMISLPDTDRCIVKLQNATVIK